jgi:hypothetical protein
MDFLSRASRCTLTDRAHNATVRDALQIRVFAVEERVYDYGDQWRNYKLRLNSARLTPEVKNYQPDGRRNVAQPRRVGG